jgi:hypothetical protein
MCGPAHFPHSVFGVAVWGLWDATCVVQHNSHILYLDCCTALIRSTGKVRHLPPVALSSIMQSYNEIRSCARAIVGELLFFRSRILTLYILVQFLSPKNTLKSNLLTQKEAPYGLQYKQAFRGWVLRQNAEPRCLASLTFNGATFFLIASIRSWIRVFELKGGLGETWASCQGNPCSSHFRSSSRFCSIRPVITVDTFGHVLLGSY